MIHVTIEMWPLGDEKRKRHMATIDIHNDAEETIATKGRKGTYVGHFSRISQRGDHLGTYERIGVAKGVNRNESGAVYRILHGVLASFLDRE